MCLAQKTLINVISKINRNNMVGPQIMYIYKLLFILRYIATNQLQSFYGLSLSNSSMSHISPELAAMAAKYLSCCTEKMFHRSGARQSGLDEYGVGPGYSLRHSTLHESYWVVSALMSRSRYVLFKRLGLGKV